MFFHTKKKIVFFVTIGRDFHTIFGTQMWLFVESPDSCAFHTRETGDEVFLTFFVAGALGLLVPCQQSEYNHNWQCFSHNSGTKCDLLDPCHNFVTHSTVNFLSSGKNVRFVKYLSLTVVSQEKQSLRLLSFFFFQLQFRRVSLFSIDALKMLHLTFDY